jgi:hypothetical protein
MRQRAYKHHLEILLSANMLAWPRTWDGMARSLPAGTCLLITDENKDQIKAQLNWLSYFGRRERGSLSGK